MKDIDPNLLKSMMMGDYRPGNEESAPLKESNTNKNKSIFKVIDLHADKLFQNRKMPAPNSILNQQLESLNDFIEKAHAQRIVSIIAVHGKGEGILKKNIYQKLTNHPKVKSYKPIEDNPYFGGASRIYLL
jgi:hypothetical protein